MKTLRPFILALLLSVVSLVCATAQSLAQQPEASMHSTSAMVGSGSSLPSAAVTGVSTTYSPANATSRPRRVGEGDGFEDEDEPDKPGEPFPLGDVIWPLMLFACAYVILRAARKVRKKVK